MNEGLMSNNEVVADKFKFHVYRSNFLAMNIYFHEVVRIIVNN